MLTGFLAITMAVSDVRCGASEKSLLALLTRGGLNNIKRKPQGGTSTQAVPISFERGTVFIAQRLCRTKNGKC